MSIQNSYSGQVGTIFKNHFHPRIFKYTAGLSIFLVIFTVMIMAISKALDEVFPGFLNAFIIGFLFLLTFGAILAKFCLAYKNGEDNIGLLNSPVKFFDSLQFGLKYVLVNIAALTTIVVVFVVIFFLIGLNAENLKAEQPNMIMSIISFIILLSGSILLMFTPFVSGILACHCDSMKTIFCRATWALLWQRKSDLFLSYGLIVITNFLFVILYGIGMAIVAGLLQKILPALFVSVIIGIFAIMIFSTNIVLFSRFCAAFSLKE